MDFVHSRAVRKLLLVIILNVLKCVFYSRLISSAGVLTPPHNLVYNGTELYEAKKYTKRYYHVYNTTTACIIYLGLLRGSNDLTATTGTFTFWIAFHS